MELFIFGDSITQGFFDDEAGGWCNRLGVWGMKNDGNPKVFNLGVSGDNTTNVLARFEVELLAREPEQGAAVVFAIGINDAQSKVADGENRVPLPAFEANLKVLHENARAHVGDVCFVGLTPVDEKKVNPMPWKSTHGYTVGNVKLYDTAIRSFCEDVGASFIPMLDVFGEGPLDVVLSDGLHPNAEGHRLMFERIKEALEENSILIPTPKT